MSLQLHLPLQPERRLNIEKASTLALLNCSTYFSLNAHDMFVHLASCLAVWLHTVAHTRPVSSVSTAAIIIPGDRRGSIKRSLTQLIQMRQSTLPIPVTDGPSAPATSHDKR